MGVICLNALRILSNRFKLRDMVMGCAAYLLISILVALILIGIGSLVSAQTDTTTSTKTTETHPEPNTTLTTTITTTITSASPTQTSKNSFTPTPTPTPAPTPTPTPAPRPTRHLRQHRHLHLRQHRHLHLRQHRHLHLRQHRHLHLRQQLAANGTIIQSSAPSGKRPINENAGGNFLGVFGINASIQQAPENIVENVLDSNQSTRWSGKGNGTWIQADFGSEKPIKSVGIAWYKGTSRQSNFEISVSNTTEAKDFVKVFTGQVLARLIQLRDMIQKAFKGNILE